MKKYILALILTLYSSNLINNLFAMEVGSPSNEVEQALYNKIKSGNQNSLEETIIKYKIDVNNFLMKVDSKDLRYTYQLNLLHLAILLRQDFIARFIIIKYKINVNVTMIILYSNGTPIGYATPIYIATQFKLYDLVYFLYYNRADVNIFSRFPCFIGDKILFRIETPLHYAKLTSNLKMMSMLRDRCKADNAAIQQIRLLTTSSL